MNQPQIKIDEKGKGQIIIDEGSERIALMEIGIKNDQLTVYHTEVAPAAEGKGFAKILLDSMVSHAREHHLHVVPLCSYVQAQFKRHPEQFSDIWTDTTHK
ncbi:MAG: N-acetyltransferase [Chitinophagaceae bacterium]|nr:N-acetyltransferase [Chitinophagaceae bacterium]